MTYKQLETSREARMWISQVIIPVIVCVGMLFKDNPELKEKAKNTYKDIKNRIKR